MKYCKENSIHDHMASVEWLKIGLDLILVNVSKRASAMAISPIVGFFDVKFPQGVYWGHSLAIFLTV